LLKRDQEARPNCFLRETFGTVPEDLVGYFGGDWLKVRRAENAARLFREAKARLDARNASPEPPSISLLVPLVVAAADEDRDELRDIWARLLAAAADPNRAQSFRAQFIEAAKQMDPLDAAVLHSAENKEGAEKRAGRVRQSDQNDLAAQLKVRRDEIEVSLRNLARLNLMDQPTHTDFFFSAFGREFLRAISD
jgi:Abortive infection alpha